MRGVALAGIDFVDQAPTEENALQAWGWLEGTVREFAQFGPRIRDLQHRAAGEAFRAKERGDFEGHAEGQAVIRRLHTLYDRWDRVNTTLQRWNLQPDLGAALAPWIYLGVGAGTVVATAASVAWVLARYGAEARIVELLAQERLTADEAARLLAETEGADPFGSLGRVASTVLLVGGLFLAWQVFGDG